MADPHSIRTRMDALKAQLPFADLEQAASELSALCAILENLARDVSAKIDYDQGGARDNAIRAMKTSLLADQGKAQMRFNAALDAVMKCQLMENAPEAPPIVESPVHLDEYVPARLSDANIAARAIVPMGDTEGFGGSDFPQYECEHCQSANHDTPACPYDKGGPSSAPLH